MTLAEQQAYLAEHLRPLQLPDESLWWPLAPGWWLLALCIATLLMTLAYHLFRTTFSRSTRQHHKRRILADFYERYQRDKNVTQYLHNVSTLLRQTAIAQSGRKSVAALSGDAWVSWMQSQTGQVFAASTQQLLTSGLYQPQPKPPDKQFHNDIERWLIAIDKCTTTPQARNLSRNQSRNQRHA